MRRFLNILLMLGGMILLLGGLCVTVGAAYLLPYTQTKMDVSMLRLTSDGSPAALYAASPEDRAARQGEYHRLEDDIPSPAGRYIPTAYVDIPPHLINAFVAIEDKRFFEHNGVDLLRTAKAGWNYITQGNSAFGGSTITQQLIKNLSGRDEHTPQRKLTEIFTAIDLEKQAHKEEILEAYMNIINLANGCRGVGAAADFYFGKQVGELTLTECACIAAITNNPSLYDPCKHPENNLARRNLILTEMATQGYITEEERDRAMASPLALSTPKQEESPNRVSSWYADMVTSDVIRDLQTRLGYTKEQATLLYYHGNLTVETAMDEDVQAILSAYYENTGNFPTGEAGRPQSAMMIMDPMTGDILAVAGAVGEKTGYRVQNYATDTQRPAGSVIKPLSVYAPALAKGLITFGSVFEDEPIAQRGGNPWPRNADGLYRGRMTVRDAVALSVNTIPVTLVETMGLESTFSFLRDDLHMKSLVGADGEGVHDMTVSSLAMGQQSGGVTVREITAAYGIFYEGVWHEPVSYHRVLDADGRVLLENAIAGETVLSRENAAIMTRLLEGVTENGTAKGMEISGKLGISVAGKTGTTQNNCDRWFIGYTPRLMGGVWMGYDYPAELRGVDGNPCIDIWDEVMTACETVYRGRQAEKDFNRHPNVIPVTICPLSGMIATPACYEALSDHDTPTHRLIDGWYAAGSEPRACCPLHGREA